MTNTRTMMLAILLLMVMAGQAWGQTYATSAAVTDTALATYNATYLTARNAETSTNLQPNIQVGQEGNGTAGGTRRSPVAFVIPAMTQSCDACTVKVRGVNDRSVNDFDVYLLGANASRSTVDGGDYSKFDGWAASGTYTGTILNETWNSSSYSEDWCNILLNQAGRDSVFAAQGDTLWVMFISENDYNAQVATANETVDFYGTESGASVVARLALTYDTPLGWSGTIARTTDPSAIGRTDKANIEQVGR